MDYYFRKHLSIEESVKTIAKELITDAVSECSSDLLSHQEIVHSVRKKCKRIRALLRIVRPQIGSSYKNENIFFRDIARKLSDTRDRHILSETLIKLKDAADNENLLKNIEDLIEIVKNSLNEPGTGSLIKEFENDISGSIIRIEKLRIHSDGFNAIKGGIEKTYRRGRIAMRKAFSESTDENFHEWRKRVKYHYYHLELLIPIWETIVKEYSNQVHSLAEILGFHHDLNVLHKFILNSPSLDLDEQQTVILSGLINSEEERIRSVSYFLGRKIYTEKTSEISRRLGNWWAVWQKQETEIF